MQNYLINGLKAAGLLLAGLALTGCGDDITNVLDDSGLLDGDGSDRVAGGVYSTGTWKSAGTNADGNAFRACFNISVDGTKLTQTGSTCTEYQNAFSVDVDGSTDCNVYYDDFSGEVDIGGDGTFSKSFQPDLRAPQLSFEGTITNGDARGTITVDSSQWGGGVCVAKWVAYAPGNTADDDVTAEDPSTDTSPVTGRAGLWANFADTPNADGERQWSCFFVDTTGTKLTLAGNSSCFQEGQPSNINSFNVAIERGSNDCYLYLGNQDSIEVPIVNGRMALNNYRPSSFTPSLSFEGTFDSGNTASGTIRIGDDYPNSACTARWNVTKQ